jgi:hypothetical protein
VQAHKRQYGLTAICERTIEASRLGLSAFGKFSGNMMRVEKKFTVPNIS